MKLIKTLLKLIGGTIVFLILGLFVLAFLWGLTDCNWYMPGPCPEGWDPINECIEGHDCTD